MADAAQIEANHAAFQEAIADEIAWFERRAASHLQARAELRVPLLEAELLKAEQDPARIAVYHERLERVFERKWRLLMDYASAREPASNKCRASRQRPRPKSLPPCWQAPSA